MPKVDTDLQSTQQSEWQLHQKKTGSLTRPFCFYTTFLLNSNNSCTISAPLSCALLLKTMAVGFPGGTVVENLPANAGNTGSSPGLGRSHMPLSN